MEIFKIFGTIALKNQEAIDGMDATTEKAQSTSEKMGAAFSKIGSAAVAAGKVIATGLAAGATAIGALAKASLDGYAEYEQLVGGSQLLFGDAYEFIADKAANAYATVQMSQNEYLQQVNGFATGLKTAMGGNEQAAAELASRIIEAEADIVAATGNSAEAVQNAFNGIMKSNFTMLDNLQLGITPTKEGFQEVIDKVNEWNEANGRATDYQIENLADCQSALLDYVEMQGLSGYAAAEAAGTIQGSLSMVKAAWKNLVVGFADGEQDLGVLIDNLVESAKLAARNIVPALGRILGGISTALEQIIPVISAELPVLLEQLLPGLISGATSLITGLIAALPSVLGILLEQIPSILTQIGTALIEAFPVLLQTCQDLFGQIFDYVSLGLLNTGTSFDDFSAKAQEVFDSLWAAIQTVWDTVGQPIWDMIQDCVGIVRDKFSEVMPEIQEFVSTCFSDISTFWEENLKPCFEAIGDFIENTLAPVFEAVFSVVIGGVVSTTFNTIKDLWENTLKPVFTGITDFLTGVFTGDWDLAWNGVLNIVTGIWNGIQTAIETPMELAKNLVNEAIDFIKEKFDFDWEFPKLKMPHFTISGKFSLDPPSVPSFGIEWYAKAMDNPMLMTDPTIFGYDATSGNFLGGGEKGAEVVSGANTLMNMIQGAVSQQMGNLEQHLQRLIAIQEDFYPMMIDAMDFDIVFNAEAAAGAMAVPMNKALGKLSAKKGRGR